MFLLGFLWRKSTSIAAITGFIGGVVLAILFDKFLPGMAGNDTLLYTAYPNGKGAYEIPFHICMGLSFFYTMMAMILISFAGPKVNPKAIEIDSEMFKVKPQTTVLIVITLLIIVALYVKFW